MSKWNEGMTDREWVILCGNKAKRSGRPLFLCREQRPGWSARLPIYLLWCERCAEFTVTHPAGYGRIHCRSPGCPTMERVMTARRFRDRVAPSLLMLALLALTLWMMFVLIRR